jgi:hypothetical protein
MKKYFLFTGFIVLTVASALLWPFQSQKKNIANAVGAASVSLISDKTSYNIGDTFTVWVNVATTSDKLGAIEANANFEIDKLQYIAINDTNDFSEILEKSTAPGMTHVVAGKSGGLSGSATVYGVSLKALAVGQTVINLNTTTAAASDGSKMTLNLGSLTLTINPTTTVTPDQPIVPDQPANPGNGTTTTPTTTKPTTAKPKTTTKATPASYSDVVSTVMLAKSTVVFDKNIATADGKDKVCVQVSLRDQNDAAITNMTPALVAVGGADISEIALSGDAWNACISSTAAGDKKITTSVSGIVLKEQVLSFSAAVETKTSTVEKELPTAVLEKDLIEVTAEIILPAGAKVSTDRDFISISGKAKAGSIVKVTVHSDQAIEKEVTADSSGNWNLELDQTLAVGSHRVEVALADKYGNQSTTKVVAKFEVTKSSSPLIYIALGYGIFSLLIIVVTFLLIRRQNSLKTSSNR